MVLSCPFIEIKPLEFPEFEVYLSLQSIESVLVCYINLGV